jgi:hypothetical protein
MAVLPMDKGTRGYTTLLGKGTGTEFYPRVRIKVQNSTRGSPKIIALMKHIKTFDPIRPPTLVVLHNLL